MPGVKLETIVKCYGNLEVLQGIELEVQEKEFLVLVGPSGCRKSKALRMKEKIKRRNPQCLK